jgi:hypothetical protein
LADTSKANQPASSLLSLNNAHARAELLGLKIEYPLRSQGKAAPKLPGFYQLWLTPLTQRSWLVELRSTSPAPIEPLRKLFTTEDLVIAVAPTQPTGNSPSRRPAFSTGSQ